MTLGAPAQVDFIPDISMKLIMVGTLTNLNYLQLGNKDFLRCWGSSGKKKTVNPRQRYKGGFFFFQVSSHFRGSGMTSFFFAWRVR